MKIQSKYLIFFLAYLSSYAQENVNPFSEPGPAKAVPAEAYAESFDPSGRHAEGEEPHRWDDQIVNTGGADGPKYVTINGWSNEKNDQVTVLFRVGVQQYNDSVRHLERTRGVVLMSGQPASPDFYCWLRPFHVTDKTADFIVLVSRKSAAHMYIAFIPHEGSRRYLYSLGEAAKVIIEKQRENPDLQSKQHD